MQIWAGLGNPGTSYALNRHNVGFMTADVIASEKHFAPWKKAFQGQASLGQIDQERILLLKPATFMNESGRAIGEAMRFYKLTPEDVTVFHDELDIAPMRVKVKRGGGAAGHNGLRSTIAHIGENFRRVRLGIGHPGEKSRVHGYVLGNYAKSETDALAHMLSAINHASPWLANGDDARFMSEIALSRQS
ncbi:MAG: aminoacyl-tRNA hydrolase [Zymomonas mobilis]|uniref:Peptidyl-tRNA hydrolase n=1 Tax=Zymomonas mobilis TaxID=542 RepID=A0A542VYX3_ZYMMB|nr:aminoacyl-tRNA hydrolase [Zymomonas mobilis]TQL16521.1 peptidyl-tRNA hydrolase [Zymomonas mobilis]